MTRSTTPSGTGALPFYACLAFLCAAFIAGISFGVASVGPGDIWGAVIGEDRDSVASMLFFSVRLPRTLAGLFAGIGLSVAGVILQSVMNNPLASPNTIGINAGAGLTLFLSILLVPDAVAAVPAAAFAGALVTAVVVFAIAQKTGAARGTIILAGIAVTGFVSAWGRILMLTNPDILYGASDFFLGDISAVTIKRLVAPVIIISTGFAGSIILSRALNVLSLGDPIARSLGLHVPVVRFVAIVTASALSGAVVSYGGLIGFVGLIVPHVCRVFVGNDAGRLIPCSAAFGGGLVILCDLAARTLFAPSEIPVGIVLSIIGSPFFVFLLFRRKGGFTHD